MNPTGNGKASPWFLLACGITLLVSLLGGLTVMEADSTRGLLLGMVGLFIGSGLALALGGYAIVRTRKQVAEQARVVFSGRVRRAVRIFALIGAVGGSVLVPLGWTQGNQAIPSNQPTTWVMASVLGAIGGAVLSVISCILATLSQGLMWRMPPGQSRSKGIAPSPSPLLPELEKTSHSSRQPTSVPEEKDPFPNE